MNRSTLALVMAVAAIVCAAQEPEVTLFQKYLHATPYEDTPESLIQEIDTADASYGRMRAAERDGPTSSDCRSIQNLHKKIACYKSIVKSPEDRESATALSPEDAQMRDTEMMGMNKKPTKVVVNVKGKQGNVGKKVAGAYAKGKGRRRRWGPAAKGAKIHAANQELDYAAQAAKTERQAGAQSNIAATAQKVAVRAAKVTIQKQKVVDKVRKVLEKAEDSLQVAKDNEAKASATAEEESERAAQLQRSAKVMSQKAAMTEASKEARSVKEPIVVLKKKSDIHQGSAKKKRL